MDYYSNNENKFEDSECIRKSYTTIDYGEEKVSGSGLNIITDGKEAVVADVDNNAIINGSTGSKKSRDVFGPLGYACIKAGENLIINDPKLELYKMLYNSMKGKYNIKVLDFRNPNKSETYNPLAYYSELYKTKQGKGVDGFADCGESIMSLVHSEKDSFWEKGAASMFTGYACICSEAFEDPNMCNLKNIYQLHLQGAERFGISTYINEYFDDKTSKAYEELNTYLCAPRDTKTSLDAVFSGAISKFIQNEDINEMISTTTSFSIPKLMRSKKPFAIFISNRDETSLYNPIVTMIIDQFYQQLVELAHLQNGALKRRTNFILDEFGTSIGRIPDINSKLSACRSRNIRFYLGVQSLSQLSLIYGKNEANIIMQNCNDWVYLNSNDMELLKTISERCGNISNANGIQRPLVPVEKLMHLQKDIHGKTQTLFLIGRNYPFFSYLPDIEDYYGIRILKNNNLKPHENRPTCELIDFQQIVKNKKNDKLKALMNEEIDYEEDF